MNQPMVKKSGPPFAIPRGVLVPDPKDVQSYLKKHKKLAAILPAICRKTRNEFGNRAELTLVVYRDPEIDDHYLALYVRLPSYDQGTMERIHQITSGFEEELTESSGWFLLTTDFRVGNSQHGI